MVISKERKETGRTDMEKKLTLFEFTLIYTFDFLSLDARLLESEH